MVHQVAQDETGFVWLATDFGLYRYDGYEVRAYKSDVRNPALLPSNMVISVAADLQGRLWIGTQEGLCRMHLSTGEVGHYLLGGVKKTACQQPLRNTQRTSLCRYHPWARPLRRRR